MDWTLFARYAAPVLAAVVAAVIARYWDRRPRLVSYLPHASSVRVTPPAGAAFSVHTHSVVVRNTGRQRAVNVRLGHKFLPNFGVYPSVPYEVLDLPAGGSEIVFPDLVPGEQVTVNYLYYPPVVWSDVNSYAKSDEGLAKIVSVLPTPQPPAAVRRIALFLVAVGAITVLFGISQLLVFLVHRWSGA
ncbi:MAG: hypothetical protein KJZ57_01320 [Anaerolineales bacterium]|nr:hypothetical protein [Anaerolineales bacterium]